jgi:MMP endo-(1,4)-3-O-methyl-alpha-D-mannosidase
MQPEVAGVLSARELGTTIDGIVETQRSDGCIPWWEGGRADPWNHVEAAMALDVGSRFHEAARAYQWLADSQDPDGSWAAAYQGKTILDPTRDANFCAYAAAGVWHHWSCTNDRGFLEAMWPVVEQAIEFTLNLQAADGTIMWARDSAYLPWPRALLTSCSCIHISLRAAIAIAQEVGLERPDWELSLANLSDALVGDPRAFQPKHRFAMDWYYPVLSGALTLEAAEVRLLDLWPTFVVEGRGCRCVTDRPWVTAAETCELVIALHGVGRTADAFELFCAVQYLRDNDGRYWTGATFPDDVVWPREKTTWSAAAVVLAADVLTPGGTIGELFARREPVSEPLTDPL